MFYKNYLVLLPGIVLAFVLYTLSQGFNNIIGIEILGYDKSPISTAMISILLGIFFGNFIPEEAAQILKIMYVTSKFVPNSRTNTT